MMKIENLYKNFGQKEVLHGINLLVDKPQVYGLIGPNGAGKTTLMRIICGILPASGGKVEYLDGHAQQDIAYMPDMTGLYTDMTVIEEIKYIGLLHGLSAKEAIANAALYMKRLGLLGYIDTPIGALSKGTVRKVQFVCTFLTKPHLVILDEPFSGLDPLSANEVEKIILEKKCEGVTVFLSTHRMEHAERFCDHIFLINQGHLIIDDNIEHLKMSYLKQEYQIDSLRSIGFDKSHVLLKEKANGFYRYVLQIDGLYTYQQMMKDIGEVEILSIYRKKSDLNEIFINTVKQL